MKLKSILSFTALISTSVLLFSCGPRSCYCRCRTNSTNTMKDYQEGNISLLDAAAKCNTLRTQNGWDTCIAQQAIQ